MARSGGSKQHCRAVVAENGKQATGFDVMKCISWVFLGTGRLCGVPMLHRAVQGSSGGMSHRGTKTAC